MAKYIIAATRLNDDGTIGSVSNPIEVDSDTINTVKILDKTYVKQKHGRWLKTGQSFIFPEKFRNYFCSECLFEIDRKSIRTEYLYCPICGAKMDEVEE